MTENNQFLTSKEVYRIYNDHGSFIRKVIQFNIKNSSEVEDVFQSFFLRLLEKPVPKKEFIKERSYLYRMIKNNIVDDVRRTRAYKKHISKLYSCIPYDPIYDPCEQVIQNEKNNSIAKIIENQLSPNIKKTLKLRYQKKYSNEQIANEMFIKKKTVIKYISRGIEKLKEILNDNKKNN